MSTRVKTPLALLAGLLLVGAAGWRGSAAPATTSQHVTATPPAITHAIGGARDSYADVVKVVAPAVVTIHTEGRARVSPTEFQGPDDFFQQFFGPGFGGRGTMPTRPQKERALGSGVIVSADGYILTNYHLVGGADDVRVDLNDGRTLTAKVVGTDKPSDLALIKIAASGLDAITVGDSDAVQVGDVVLAVGNPLGIGQTVTMGIISAKGRSTAVGDGSYEDFLQTDAPINHGNSGGALVNTKGELVGINSQILSPNDGNIGIGFAIPANMARHVMEQLRANGRVERAQLGVTVQPVTSDMAASFGLKQVEGAIVDSVSAGGAADKAGLKRGDVITSFNGQPVRDPNSLRNRVADATPGATATLGVIRDGAEKTFSVKLQEASTSRSARDNGGENDDKAALGIAAAPLTPEIADELGLPKSAKGVVVQQVDPDGRAADAGIQAGDVIQEVNRQPVQSVDDLRAAVRKSSDKPLLLLVNRKGNDLFIPVRAARG